MLTLSALWALAFKVLIPVLLVVAYSQRSLADRLGITRHAVRSALA